MVHWEFIILFAGTLRIIIFVFNYQDLISTSCSEQVKVLALTDHDTMAGIPEATEAARRFGIKIIPGVEISTIYSPRYSLSRM